MMANVFEGKPDDRQSDLESLRLSRFRPRYRALSEEEKALHDEIKGAYDFVGQLLERLPVGRYYSLAWTSLEESCMWAIKQLTDNPPDKK
jgi:hypothetical protein